MLFDQRMQVNILNDNILLRQGLMHNFTFLKYVTYYLPSTKLFGLFLLCDEKKNKDESCFCNNFSI